MILVTFMWGSWFQTIKHIGDYPIIGYTFWLYFFSPVTIWIAILFLKNDMVPEGIGTELLRYPDKAVLVLLCGMIFAVGMQLQMIYMQRLGMILTTSICATSNVLGSTFITSFLAGLPKGASFVKILIASVLLILATIVCQTAGSQRNQDVGKGGEQDNPPVQAKLWDILILIGTSLMLTSFPLAMSLTLRSDLRPEGFSSLTLMGILSVGAFLGALAFTVPYLKKNGTLHRLMEPWKKGRAKILLLALISSICHFGGNVLQSIFAPVIGVAIASPMGVAYNVWAYFWGLVYGEFRGSSKKTYAILASGVLLFVAGVLLLTTNIV